MLGGWCAGNRGFGGFYRVAESDWQPACGGDCNRPRTGGGSRYRGGREAMISHNKQLQVLEARIQNFVAKISPDNVEMRVLMRRLLRVIQDRDCSDDILHDCEALYGLTGSGLKTALVPLIADYEAQILAARSDRDRIESFRLNKELLMDNHLRDFYFSLAREELERVWKNGENDLAETERNLVRMALRNKLGLGHAGESVEFCSGCLLPKEGCICNQS